MAEPILQAASPLRRTAVSSAESPAGSCGVIIRECAGGQLASLASRRGGLDALAEAVRAEWGVALPSTPRRVEAGPLAFIWSGPERWMVTGDAGPDLEAMLQARLGDLAATTDQSDSRTLLRVQGSRVRDALAKMIGIDLHPRAFAPGDVALTVAGHINVHLWQLDEQPAYEIGVFRSLAGSFHHALCVASAEYGVDAAA